MIYSNASNQRIMLGAAITSPAAGGATWPEFVQSVRLEQRRLDTSVLKRLNFIEFRTDVASESAQIFTAVADSVKLGASRPYGLAVLELTPTHFVVALYKEDGAKVHFPAGAVARYCVPAPTAGVTRLSGMELLVHFFGIAGPRTSNMHPQRADEVNALDVVATAREMTMTALLITRLQAQLVPVKNRTNWEKALCSGWDSLCKLLDGLNAVVKPFDICVASTDWPALKRLQDYDNLETHTKCSYYDANAGAEVDCGFREVMTTHIHERGVVIGGPAGAGKTVLACAMAKDAALMYGPGDTTPVHEHYFCFTDGVQSWGDATLEEGKVVVTDDSEVGQAAFWNASAPDYLKDFVWFQSWLI